MSHVTPRPDYGIGGSYVIEHEGGYSTLGFDNALDRLERYSLDYWMDGEKTDELMARMHPQRGSMEVYREMRKFERLLAKRAVETGERAVADLSPQLVGLEGCRVEAVTEYDETRRFIVGKSTGPIPCHLEIKRRDSSGGTPADREYKSVKVLERVR